MPFFILISKMQFPVIDGTSENESNLSAIMIHSTDDWLVGEPSNFYESIGCIEISAFNSDTQSL